MIPFLAPLFGNPKILLWGGILIALVIAIFWFRSEIREGVYQEFYAAEVDKKLNEQQQEIVRLNETIKLREKSIATLEARKEKVRIVYKTIYDKAADPKLQDGEVAPVLRGVIDDLFQLQFPNEGGNVR